MDQAGHDEGPGEESRCAAEANRYARVGNTVADSAADSVAPYCGSI